MKKIITLILLFGTICTTQAQNPSKIETLNYLDKRVAETVGHQVIWKNGSAQFINEARFYSDGSIYVNGKYNYLYKKKDNVWNWNHFLFNPEFIKSVTEASGNTTQNSPVGFIAISFSNNLVKKDSRIYSHNGATTTYDYNFVFSVQEKGNASVVYLPYLKQDPNAFERIKKAILHLKGFHQNADPFAN